MSRITAGLSLGLVIGVWLIVWIPMALYALFAFALSPLFPDFPKRSRPSALKRAP
jgi:hypothetical protein